MGGDKLYCKHASNGLGMGWKSKTQKYCPPNFEGWNTLQNQFWEHQTQYSFLLG